MKVSGIGIAVKDLDSSLKFYTEVLGFKHLNTFTTSLGRSAFLLADNMHVGLVETQKINSGLFDFCLKSEDIEKDIESLKSKGAKVTLSIHNIGLGKLAQVSDPNGTLITILQWNQDYEKNNF